MYVSDQIMVKVAAREEENANFKRCIEVRVCPKCGNDLEVTGVREDRSMDYICTNCEFTHST